jgi:hypothetical protein
MLWLVPWVRPTKDREIQTVVRGRLNACSAQYVCAWIGVAVQELPGLFEVTEYVVVT